MSRTGPDAAARVLTKKPIRFSISARPRLAVGVPMTTSCWPESLRQQRRPASQQSHEQGRAMTPAQFLELRRQLLVQHQARKGPGKVLLRRAGMIGGQLQQRRCSGQRRLPVLGLLLQDLALDPLPLPDAHSRHTGSPAPAEDRPRHAETRRRARSVRLMKIAHRPAVGDDVVHGDQQRMFVFA